MNYTSYPYRKGAFVEYAHQTKYDLNESLKLQFKYTSIGYLSMYNRSLNDSSDEPDSIYMYLQLLYQLQ